MRRQIKQVDESTICVTVANLHNRCTADKEKTLQMIRRDDVSLLLAIQQPAPNILASLRIYTYFFKSKRFIYKPDDRQLHYDFLKK